MQDLLLSYPCLHMQFHLMVYHAHVGTSACAHTAVLLPYTTTCASPHGRNFLCITWILHARYAISCLCASTHSDLFAQCAHVCITGICLFNIKCHLLY